MDGGRRVLRSLRESVSASLPLVHAAGALSAPAMVGASASAYHRVSTPRPADMRRASRRAATAERWLRRFKALSRPGVGLFATLLLFASVGFAGFVQNGGYANLVAREGQPWDIAARAFGFDISAVTITGQARLTESELLAASGVAPQQSLPFLDAGQVRDRLLAIPLIKNARVMKLYPNRLVVAIEERMPHALWQRDGRVAVVSEDGVAIDELRDNRYLGLPFVVGDGAQKRLPEFSLLMKTAGDLAQRVKAGVLVAGRRWDLQMTNGVMVKLPEQDPASAVATLTRLQRDAHLLDKDIMSVDFRTPDRVTVRLTEESAASREATLSRKLHKSGG